MQREVTDFVDFTRRTDAVQAVDVRPRVTGYLERIPFKEGSDVKKGDLLFEIDPRPYQAQLDQAKSQVALNEAQLKLAQSTYARAAPLVASGAGARAAWSGRGPVAPLGVGGVTGVRRRRRVVSFRQACMNPRDRFATLAILVLEEDRDACIRSRRVAEGPDGGEEPLRGLAAAAAGT